MTRSGNQVRLADLLKAVSAAIPERAVVASPGALPEDDATGRTFVSFEPTRADAADQPVNSASAIIELERRRACGASFLALPTPTNTWLEELELFGEHCRSRYDIVFESADLGTLVDLRRHSASNTQDREAPTGVASVNGGGGGASESATPIDELGRTLALLVRREGYSGEEFRVFERYGVHVTPVHFYHPIPDTSQLSEDIWSRSTELVGIDMNDHEQLRLVREVFPQFRDEYEALPTGPTEDRTAFYLGNDLFDGTDALVLYCMLRHLQPRRVIEVGSGFSTRLAAQAARKNGLTNLVCIEPYPDEVLQAGFPGLASLITSRVEDVSLSLFGALEAGDVLFIDSSHVVRIGGDVTFLILEVLPRLKPGVVVQLHDIFLPLPYPREWVAEGLRFWSEQYLLQAFLTYNSTFRVVLANNYLRLRYPSALRDAFPSAPWWGGGSFWIERNPE